MPMHVIEWNLDMMNNVLINEDKDQHNVLYLLQIIIPETKNESLGGGGGSEFLLITL